MMMMMMMMMMHAEVRIPDKMGCFCWVVKAKCRFFRSRPEKVLESDGAQNKGLLDVGSAYISREVEVCELLKTYIRGAYIHFYSYLFMTICRCNGSSAHVINFE